MASETSTQTSPQQPEAAPATARPPRYWPGILLLVTYWIFEFTIRLFEPSMFVLFISRFAALLIVSLGFTTWWLVNRTLARRDKWYAVALTTVGMILAMLLAVPGNALGVMGFGIPIAFTAGLAWLVLTKHAPLTLQRRGLFVVVSLVWVFCALLRWEGLHGDQSSVYRWRWEPTAEEEFLAARAAQKDQPAPGLLQKPVEPASHDVTDFRGKDRAGSYAGFVPRMDWETRPPKLLWEQRVGPAWSSMIVVGGRLYTQEQRGEAEAVVCYDANTGQELWAQQETARFSENVSGPGPRATPTFADGKIFAAGATGRITCLDASSGKPIWSRNLASDAGVEPPQWGYSSSPLVVDDLVIAFAGGSDHGLVAHRVKDGALAWYVGTGPMSYSSPQLNTLHGTKQVLFISGDGLIGVEPATGKLLWKHALEANTLPAIQPHVVDDEGDAYRNTVLAQSGAGLILIDVQRAGDEWTTSQRWQSRALRPSFNDVVIHGKAIFGLDEGILCCIDLATGKREWKAGRYGYGQVLLLPEAALLLVLSEKGQAVLVAAQAGKGRDEIARHALLDAKTWNHPIFVGNKLYVRNAEKMACYELPGRRL